MNNFFEKSPLTLPTGRQALPDRVSSMGRLDFAKEGYYIVKKSTEEAIYKVHQLFKRRGHTLAVAESCTGGLISHYITSLPGASVFFRAGVVSYSEAAKTDILGISPEIIRIHGVVSKSTAIAMAEKVRSLVKTDFSIATTGNLGPDVLAGSEKGLVCIAADREGKTVSKELRLQGGREENKEEAARAALQLLIELMDKEHPLDTK